MQLPSPLPPQIQELKNEARQIILAEAIDLRLSVAMVNRLLQCALDAESQAAELRALASVIQARVRSTGDERPGSMPRGKRIPNQ